MSLIYSDINPQYGTTSVWKVSEETSFFKNTLKCDVPKAHSQSKKRAREWLCSRYLIYKMEHAAPADVQKDEFGKPFIVNQNRQLSISHSNGYVAVAFHNDEIGLDIQTYVSKIYRIESKYTSQQEVSKYEAVYDKIQSLHIIWTIKEAVFKLYGKKELPFKEGISLQSVSYSKNSIFTFGEIKKAGITRQFRAETFVRPDYCISRAIY